MPSKDFQTIGEVVKRLQGAYPDLTVSKVRFLEDEGLIAPSRTPSGYRKFSQRDIDRLEAILRMQKTYFYPLSIIREKLDEMDSGRELEELAQEDVITLPSDLENKKHPIENIPDILGVEIAFVRTLVQYGVIELTTSPKGRSLVDGHDLKLIKAAAELKRYGVDARHLRMYANAAHRESVVIEQVLSNMVPKQASEISAEDRKRFRETYATLESLINNVRGSFLMRDIRKEFKNLNL